MTLGQSQVSHTGLDDYLNIINTFYFIKLIPHFYKTLVVFCGATHLVLSAAYQLLTVVQPSCGLAKCGVSTVFCLSRSSTCGAGTLLLLHTHDSIYPGLNA